MGHRTLVAYDRAGYDLHYCHWGVDPAAITPETPFGGPPGDAWARECAGDLVDPEGGHLAGDHDTAVDPDPVATGLSFLEVCACVDPLVHEALYVVDPEFDVRTYLVLALRAPDRQRPVAALVGHDGEGDAAYLRGWLAGARAVRDVHGLADGAVLRALRWLDADRGTLVYLDREAGVGGDGDGGTDGQRQADGEGRANDEGRANGGAETDDEGQAESGDGQPEGDGEPDGDGEPGVERGA
jgi:hypothetical protein